MRKIAVSRRAFFITVTILVPLLGLELASFAIIHLRGDSVASIRKARRRVASGVKAQPAPRIEAGRSDPVVPHPYLGFVYEQHLTADRHGFLGDDILRSRGSSVFNVVITGGSVAANFYSDVGPDLAKALQAFPRVDGKETRVFTFAVGGWHQPQQMLAVAYFLSIGAQIDMVVNIDGFNEVAIPVGQLPQVSPYYPRGWQALTSGMDDSARRADLGRLALYDASRQRLAAALHVKPLRYWIAGTLVWQLTDGVLQRRATAVSARLEKIDGLAPFQSGYLPRWNTDAAIAASAEMWVESSKVMHAMLRNRGAAYVHVLQPSQYVPGSKTLTAGEERDAYRPETKSAIWARQGYEIMQRRAPELTNSGIEYLDATGIYAGTSDAIYVDFCCHVNRAGNVILMNAILGSLRQHGQLALSPSRP